MVITFGLNSFINFSKDHSDETNCRRMHFVNQLPRPIFGPFAMNDNSALSAMLPHQSLHEKAGSGRVR
jgi:hypothetical protein